MHIIGRKAELQQLDEYMQSGKAEFVALYGRRRVGKTYLVEEYYNHRFAFNVTGVIDGTRLSTLEDKSEQIRLYGRYGVWRIVAVSNGMILGIICFYLMGAYQSMIWAAAISAIGWYFTKPSIAKMESELTPKDPNQETY